MKRLLTIILILFAASGCATVTPQEKVCRQKYLLTAIFLDSEYERWADENLCSFETNAYAVKGAVAWSDRRFREIVVNYRECLSGTESEHELVQKLTKNLEKNRPEMVKEIRARVLNYRGNYCK